jgi:hypothetical protein
VIHHRKPEDNRIKAVRVEEGIILNCFVINSTSPGDCLTKLCLKGVPDGTLIVGSYYDQLWNSHTVLLYNSQWPIVERGSMPEVLKLETQIVQVKADVPRLSRECQPLILEPEVHGLHLGSSDSGTAQDAALGEPHRSPFDKEWADTNNETWRERKSQL